MLKTVKTIGSSLAVLAASATPILAAGYPQVKGGDICGLLSIIGGFIGGLAGAIALILLIMGGIQYMSSGGDKIAVEQARGRITAAIVGLVIVFGAYLVVNTLGGAIFESFNLCQVP